MPLKTFLLAIAATAAILGAAVVGVPSSFEEPDNLSASIIRLH
jgi:hypothetical protein